MAQNFLPSGDVLTNITCEASPLRLQAFYSPGSLSSGILCVTPWQLQVPCQQDSA